jgi:hypothetical protein
MTRDIRPCPRLISGALLAAILLPALPAGAQGPLPGGTSFPDPRTRVINDSYQRAFCRNPDPMEIRHWLQYPQSGDLNYLYGMHRQWLRQSAQERTGTIQRSYYVALRRNPNQAEVNWWSAQVQQNGYTCEELKQFHQRR